MVELKDYTAAEMFSIQEIHKRKFEMVVYGISFQVVIDDYKGIPCYYIEEGSCGYNNLISSVKEFRKLSTLRTYIETSLSKLNKQLSAFKKDHKLAFEKYYNWDFEPECNYSKDENTRYEELKVYLIKNPSCALINKHMSSRLKNDKPFFSDLYKRLVHQPNLSKNPNIKLEYMKLFEHFEIDFLLPVFLRTNRTLDDFEKKTFEKTLKDKKEIIEKMFDCFGVGSSFN
jgi:hypothetical protein